MLGLVIAAVGIYGVMAYMVAQRTIEIGVRMALGATPAAVVRMILTRASLLMLAGLAIGGVVSWSLSAAVQVSPFRWSRTRTHSRRGYRNAGARRPGSRGHPGPSGSGRGFSL